MNITTTAVPIEIVQPYRAPERALGPRIPRPILAPMNPEAARAVHMTAAMTMSIAVDGSSEQWVASERSGFAPLQCVARHPHHAPDHQQGAAEARGADGEGALLLFHHPRHLGCVDCAVVLRFVVRNLIHAK